MTREKVLGNRDSSAPWITSILGRNRSSNSPFGLESKRGFCSLCIDHLCIIKYMRNPTSMQLPKTYMNVKLIAKICLSTQVTLHYLCNNSMLTLVSGHFRGSVAAPIQHWERPLAKPYLRPSSPESVSLSCLDGFRNVRPLAG